MTRSLSLLCATANQYRVLMEILCYIVGFLSEFEAFYLGNILFSRSDCESCHCRFGVVEGSWVIWIIDEIQLPKNSISFHPSWWIQRHAARKKVPQKHKKEMEGPALTAALLTT